MDESTFSVKKILIVLIAIIVAIVLPITFLLLRNGGESAQTENIVIGIDNGEQNSVAEEVLNIEQKLQILEQLEEQNANQENIVSEEEKLDILNQLQQMEDVQSEDNTAVSESVPQYSYEEDPAVQEKLKLLESLNQ